MLRNISGQQFVQLNIDKNPVIDRMIQAETADFFNPSYLLIKQGPTCS
tara:strand:+ start:33352 stop:33495 length:144 start_codon:yes stop_codon:yes gene_type:complete